MYQDSDPRFQHLKEALIAAEEEAEAVPIAEGAVNTDQKQAVRWELTRIGEKLARYVKYLDSAFPLDHGLRLLGLEYLERHRLQSTSTQMIDQNM